MEEILEIIVGINESKEPKEISLQSGFWYVELSPYNLVKELHQQYYVCAVIQKEQRMDSTGNKIELFHSTYKTRENRPIIQVPLKIAEAFIYSFLMNSALNFGALHSQASQFHNLTQYQEKMLMDLLYSNER